MAIQYVGGNTAVKVGATSGNTTVSLTTLTGGISASAAINDVVIAVFSTGSAANRTLSITDGTTAYTLIATELYSNGTTYDTNLRVAYKKLTAADTTVTFGPTLNAQDAGAMAVYVFRGVADAIFDVTTTTATGTGTGRPTPPAITPVTSGTFIVCVGASAAGTGAVFTTATLSSFRTVTSPDTNDAMLGIGQFAWTSGTYTPAQFGGGTTNAADSWAAMSIALREFRTPITTTILESNSTLGNAVNASVLTAGSSSTYWLDQTRKAGATFIAPTTGQLGNVKIGVYSIGSTLPSDQGAIELWQLASNSITALPSTLIASLSIPYILTTTTPPSGYPTLEFDLSAVSGMTVTAGSGYAIVVASGANWGPLNASWFLTRSQTTSTIYNSLYLSGGSWTTSNLPANIELDYLNATLDSQTEDLATSATCTESAPATDTQDAAGNEQVVESVTATDSESAVYTAVAYDLESNATLGSTMNAGAYTIGSGAGALILASNKAGNSFIATQTGHLGLVKAALSLNGSPIGPGDIELWQLASNAVNAQPTTLLASTPFLFGSGAFNNGRVTVEYDLSNVTGMTVTAGTGYAIMFSGSASWAPTIGWSIISTSADNKTNLYRLWKFTSGAWSSTNQLAGIELDYTNATLDTQTATANFVSSITETGTATETEVATFTTSSSITETVTTTDAEDAINLLGAAITETGTATETETAVDIANAWLTENTVSINGGFTNVIGLLNSFTSNFLGQNNESVGIRFIANQSAVVGIITIPLGIQNGTSVPTQPVKITLWQLASNSLTAVPSINLAEINFSLTSLNLNALRREVYDFSSFNITLTAGVGYAVTATAPSDLTSSGGYRVLFGVISPINPLNYYKSIYSDMYGTYPSTYLSSAGGVIIDVQPVQATAGTQTGGLLSTADITETAPATETEDAGVGYNVDDIETVTALDTESATYNPSALITETGTATETETAVDIANAWINENPVSTNGAFINLLDAYTPTTVAITPANDVAADRFIANKTAVLGSFAFRARRINTVNPAPIQSGKIVVWQLASNSLTALPSSELGSITFNISAISTSSTFIGYVFDLSSLNITLTNGVGYAIGYVAPSDSSGSTQYLSIYAVTPVDITQENNAKNIASGLFGTYPSTYSTSPLVYEYTVQPILNTIDTQTGGFVASSTITESAPATETETASASFKVYDLESNSTLGSAVNGTSMAVPVNSGGGITYNNESGVRFIAPTTGHLGNIKANIQSSGTGADPTTQGLIKLWQLASNSITATPTTLLASTAIPYSQLTLASATNNSVEFDLSNVSGMTVTAGVGYAITFIGGADWGLSGAKFWLLWGSSSVRSDLYNGVVNVAGGWISQTTIVKSVELNYTNATLDSQTATVPLTPALITESAPATDSETASALLGANITESAPATETETANNLATADITETAPATETETAVYTPVATITESAPATDTETGGFIAISVITETGTATETEVASFSIASTITETVVALDTETAQAIFSTIIVEAGNATETESAVSTTNSTITETVTADNTQFSTYFVTAAVIETSTLADTQTSILAYTLTITESVSAVVTSVVVANFVASITESVDATDLYVTKGWYRIIDGQTPNWNPINDSQTVVWTAINDGQTPGWVLINNTQTVTWTNIDDAQNPNWTDIDDSQ
jgi:hypothetical protein